MFAALVFLLATSSAVVAGPGPEAVKRPAHAKETVLVPDQFLRRWDPVTVFFDRDRGPAETGPEDRPERFVTLEPAHPGAFRWLDARTLQFRPAEPWPALRRFTWTVDGRAVSLATLMSVPAETVPRDGQEDLDPVDAVTLSFPEPLDVEALAKMVSVELRPLPGVGGGASRWLTGDDFQIKTQERRSRADRATYVLGFSSPIPLGTRAVVHLRLSLEDAAPSFKEITFATAQPFRVLGIGCREQRYPVTPEGTRYSREQALACGSERRALVVELSATPRELGAVEARNLLRLTPAVDEAVVRDGGAHPRGGRGLRVGHALPGGPGADVHHRCERPSPRDPGPQRGLRLLPAPARLRAVGDEPRHRGALRTHSWSRSKGAAQERVDIRIHALDPLDRSFWPFPDRPVIVDESQRPPGPGEEPAAYTDPDRQISPSELAAHIAHAGLAAGLDHRVAAAAPRGQRSELRPRPVCSPRATRRSRSPRNLPRRPAGTGGRRDSARGCGCR